MSAAPRVSNQCATVWYAWLMQTVFLSFGLVLFDNVGRNILVAWILCCFDAAFIIDASVQGYHKAYRILGGSLKISPKKVLAVNSFTDVLSNWLYVFGFVSLIPYHFLFMCEVETVAYYSVVCLMRLLWIYQAHRSCFAYFTLNFQKRRVVN